MLPTIQLKKVGTYYASYSTAIKILKILIYEHKVHFQKNVQEHAGVLWFRGKLFSINCVPNP